MDNNQVSVLIQQCIKNNRMAQHKLFHLYKQKAYDLAYRSLGGNFDVDDVVQQVFIALFNSLRHFKGMSSFDTWVYRITVKVCTTQLRKKYRKRQPQISFDSTRIENDGEDSNSNPSKLFEEKEFNKLIYQALNKISAEKRMIVVMHEMEDKTLEEIAQIMKKPLGTIKSRLFHGRKALEKHLRGFNSL